MDSIQWNLLYALRYEQCEWNKAKVVEERWGMTKKEGKAVKKWIQARIDELEELKNNS